jgi:hypothetical protein
MAMALAWNGNGNGNGNPQGGGATERRRASPPITRQGNDGWYKHRGLAWKRYYLRAVERRVLAPLSLVVALGRQRLHLEVRMR